MTEGQLYNPIRPHRVKLKNGETTWVDIHEDLALAFKNREDPFPQDVLIIKDDNDVEWEIDEVLNEPA